MAQTGDESVKIGPVGAVFPAMIVLATVTAPKEELANWPMPPPVAPAELPESVQLVTVSVPPTRISPAWKKKLKMPPPYVAELAERVELVIVMLPSS